METCHKLVGRLATTMLCAVLFVAAGAAVAAEQETAQPPSVGKARMNIVFLDDAAEGLPAGVQTRRNYWPEWDARVPTFQELLRAYIADFHKARGEQPSAEASLYGLEVASGVDPAERDRQIAKYLDEIGEATKRPSFVLARSTAGQDQLRLVYVFEDDCTPEQAAGFLAALAEVSPPVPHGRIGERFGPFRAPPTIVFDPRADTLPVPNDRDEARRHWALLEEDTYLLPHYVLHLVAALHEAPLTELAERTVEPGAAMGQLANKLDQVHELRAQGGFWNQFKADHIGNQAVRLAMQISDAPGGIPNLNHLSPAHQAILTPEVRRVTTYNATGGAGRAFADATTRSGVILGTGGRALLGLAGGPEGAGVGARVGHAVGTVTLGLAGQVMGKASDRYTSFGTRYEDHLGGVSAAGTGSIERQAELSLGQESSLSDINLRPTRQELSSMMRQARYETFAGGGNLSDPQTGGIRFEDDNDYLVDLSGRIAKEVSAEARSERAARGLVMGKTRYFDELPLLWLDVVSARNGSLPVAVPRFLTAAGADAGQRFGGPWSFEPLTLDVRRNPAGQLLRATVVPAETRTPVSYMPLDLIVEGAPLLLMVRNGTGFEPDLEVRDGGGFVWTLRHGVTIEFDADGLVEVIRSPHGEHIVYRRDNGRLVGQQTSDGRRIDVRYRDARPEAATLQDEPRATYKYAFDRDLVEVRGDRQTWSIGYSRDGLPAQITGGDVRLALGHDDRGRLTSVVCGPLDLRIKYPAGTTTLHFSAAGKPDLDWLLGPISGPVMPDHAVLLTRSIAGRILQVSKGTVAGTGDTRRFVPHETITLVREPDQE